MSAAGPQTQRFPGPDVARGVALAIVAMSNTTWWMYPGREGPSLLWESADRWSGAISATLISGRAYPMFSFLFGYGIVQMLANLAARGVDNRRANAIVIRRNLLLVCLGFLHALLLFGGDILGAYGVLGFLCLLLARTHLAAIGVVASAILGFRILYDYQGWAWDWTNSYDIAGAATYAASMELRAKDWLAGWAVLPYYLAPMLLGVLAAKKRILEEPARHVALLRGLIVAGFVVSILSGMPEALVSLGEWQPRDEATWTLISVVGGAGGIAGGIALAALASLLAHAGGASGRLRALLEPVRCLGRRSLSGYLFQSLAFLLIFPSFTFGYGGRAGPTACFLIALGVWLLSLVLAVTLERSGRLGPGEWLIRRLTYGRPRQVDSVSPA